MKIINLLFLTITGGIFLGAYLAAQSSSSPLISIATPSISKATINYNANTLTITGTVLNSCSAQSLSLSGVPLTIASNTGSTVVAKFPRKHSVRTFTPGTYTLTYVESNGTENCNYSLKFEVALGSIGPRGKQGAVGPQGPQGLPGPQGLSSKVIDNAGHSYPLIVKFSTSGNPNIQALWKYKEQTILIPLFTSSIQPIGTVYFSGTNCSGVPYVSTILDQTTLLLSSESIAIYKMTLYYSMINQVIQTYYYNSKSFVSPTKPGYSVCANVGPSSAALAQATEINLAKDFVPPFHIQIN
jgi:hypothetical protein